MIDIEQGLPGGRVPAEAARDKSLFRGPGGAGRLHPLPGHAENRGQLAPPACSGDFVAIGAPRFSLLGRRDPVDRRHNSPDRIRGDLQSFEWNALLLPWLVRCSCSRFLMPLHTPEYNADEYLNNDLNRNVHEAGLPGEGGVAVPGPELHAAVVLRAGACHELLSVSSCTVCGRHMIWRSGPPAAPDRRPASSGSRRCLESGSDEMVGECHLPAVVKAMRRPSPSVTLAAPAAPVSSGARQSLRPAPSRGGPADPLDTSFPYRDGSPAGRFAAPGGSQATARSPRAAMRGPLDGPVPTHPQHLADDAPRRRRVRVHSSRPMRDGVLTRPTRITTAGRRSCYEAPYTS